MSKTSMNTVDNRADLKKTVHQWRLAGEKIAFVPTMGNLHGGHLDLIRCAKEQGGADRVVVSIFVNPTQFNRPDDLANYPRTLARDSELLQGAACDLLFVPNERMMYPSGKLATHVVIPGITDILEGYYRPGHFVGVATVVCKLFNLVLPDVAVFGQKDFQQLLVIRHMVDDLNIPVEIIGSATMREADGLAMSSRNGYLTPTERSIAPHLFKALTQVQERLPQAEILGYSELQQQAIDYLAAHGFRPEYIEIRRANDLQAPEVSDKELVVLASAWLGKARLIDNVTIKLG